MVCKLKSHHQWPNLWVEKITFMKPGNRWPSPNLGYTIQFLIVHFIYPIKHTIKMNSYLQWLKYVLFFTSAMMNFPPLDGFDWSRCVKELADLRKLNWMSENTQTSTSIHGLTLYFSFNPWTHKLPTLRAYQMSSQKTWEVCHYQIYMLHSACHFGTSPMFKTNIHSEI